MSTVAAVLAATFSLSACSSSAKSQTATGSQNAASSTGSNNGGNTGKAADPTNPATQPLPLDAYLQGSAADNKVIAQALGVVERTCMQKFGFDYQPPGPQPAQPAPSHIPFGLADLQQAQTWGYHQPASAAQDPANAGTASGAPGGADDGKNNPEQLVFVGDVKTSGGLPVPAGGCKGEAESQVLGTSTVDTSVLDPTGGQQSGAPAAPGGLAAQDPNVLKALQDWSACMQTKGFSYTDPASVPVAFLKKPGGAGAQPSSQEITVAVADVSCKTQARLYPVWFAAETAKENAYIEQHAQQFQQIKQSYDAQAKRAETIVGTAS